jgi:MoaA/NifB/PqqE/SkfB family radical SAM enzyme
MISNTTEAIKLCEKFGVNISEHSHVIVTATGNIYTSLNIDPKDTSKQFNVKMQIKEIEQPKIENEVVVETKKQRKK